MHEVPREERPRERLLSKGAENLKTAELLAILLRTGTKDRPVMELADFLLTHFGSLEALSRAPVLRFSAPLLNSRSDRKSVV